MPTLQRDAMRAVRMARRDLMTWVTCECIRVSLTGAGLGWVGVETCFHWHLLFFACCPLVYKAFQLSWPVCKALVCSSVPAVLLSWSLKLMEDLKKQHAQLEGMTLFVELLCSLFGQSPALWKRTRCRTSSLAFLQSTKLKRAALIILIDWSSKFTMCWIEQTADTCPQKASQKSQWSTTIPPRRRRPRRSTTRPVPEAHPP